MQCSKCGRSLVDCPRCNTDGAQFEVGACQACDNSGLVCPEHGGAWGLDPMASNSDIS